MQELRPCRINLKRMLEAQSILKDVRTPNRHSMLFVPDLEGLHTK